MTATCSTPGMPAMTASISSGQMFSLTGASLVVDYEQPPAWGNPRGAEPPLPRPSPPATPVACLTYQPSTPAVRQPRSSGPAPDQHRPTPMEINTDILSSHRSAT